MSTRMVLVAHRLKRAHEALEEAQWMLEKEHFNTAVNRAYYALFYAANALLETEGLVSAKHSGVRALLFQNFVNDGRLPREFAKVYASLFEDRQEGDYADLVRFDQARAEEAVNLARTWIVPISSLIATWLKEHP